MSDPGVLIQIHIPRCAGTSVSDWLRRAALHGSFQGFGAIYPDFVFRDDDQYRAVGFGDARLIAVTTHNIRMFPKTICGRPTHYFSILRRPDDHVLSIVRYMRENRVAFDLPATLGERTRDIAAWLLDRPLSAPFRENTQTNHLALHVWCEATSGRCSADTYGTWARADQHAYRSQRLDVAKDVLRTFLCVGVVDRLHDTLDLLRRRCAALGIEVLPPEAIGHINATAWPYDDVEWMRPDDPVGRRLRASVTVDCELYDFASDLLASSRLSGVVQR